MKASHALFAGHILRSTTSLFYETMVPYANRNLPAKSSATAAADLLLSNMNVIVFTPEKTAAHELHTVNRLFTSGLRCLHVRKPQCSVDELRQYLATIDSHYRSRLVLHQHHQLTRDFTLKGIHWKSANRPAPPLQALPRMTQSTGFHTLSEMQQDWQHLDYAFLSPIYDSISKQGYQAATFPRDELSAALAASSMPVYALGGVTPANCKDLAQLGFAGCAVIGTVWSAPDPVAAYLELQAACQASGRVLRRHDL